MAHATRTVSGVDTIEATYGCFISVLVNDQRHASQAQVAVGRPALSDTASLHDVQADGVSQGQILIRESAEHLDPTSLLVRSDRYETKRSQVFDQCDELKGSRPVVPLQKPAVSFGHDEGGREKAWRIRKQSPKQTVVAVEPIREGDEC
jgi:hypothetical protein